MALLTTRPKPETNENSERYFKFQNIRIFQWLWLPVLLGSMTMCSRADHKSGSKARKEKYSAPGMQSSSPIYVPFPMRKPEQKIPVTKKFMGKDRTFVINPDHKGRDFATTVWEETLVKRNRKETYTITQLSPAVLLYSYRPPDVRPDVFYKETQPMKLEFMDSSYHTIREVDLWTTRPYRDIKDAPLTYNNYDAEGAGALPYEVQHDTVSPVVYSLFTHIWADNNHVIVDYELHGIRDYYVMSVRNTLRIYDLKGNLRCELQDLPSIDDSVISPDGRYLLYVSGGNNLATAECEYGAIEREGWALVRLTDQKTIYSEYTDGLSLNTIRSHRGILELEYSSGDNKYLVFFDPGCDSLYKCKLTRVEKEALDEYLKTRNKTGWQGYSINVLNLKPVVIPVDDL